MAIDQSLMGKRGTDLFFWLLEFVRKIAERQSGKAKIGEEAKLTGCQDGCLRRCPESRLKSVKTQDSGS